VPDHVKNDARDAVRVKARCALTVLAGLLALLAPAVTPAPGSALAPRRSSTGAATATLSNLKTLSRWAYPQAAAAAHRGPSVRTRVVGHLRFLTSDGQAQVYLTLRSYTIAGESWILVPIPGRPNGRIGWVPASALGELHLTREYLRIDREAYRATLFNDGRPIWRAQIGVGRPSHPTPAGHFYVTEKLTAIGGPFYGPYAIGTSAYAPTLREWPGGGVVGIHGTDEPQLIPGRPSHGCIRLRNADIERLWPLIRVGTPIEIV
jgi:L,D-transpeptidase catalytic domain